MLGTPIEPGGRDVDVVVELLQECQRTAREAAASDLTDEPWDATRLRGRVIDLLERGGRALAVLEGTDANQWSAITWTEADPPVVLARALAIAHQRLAAAAASREDDVLVAMLTDPRHHGLDVDAAYELGRSSTRLHSEAQLRSLARHRVVPSRGDLEGNTLVPSNHRTQQRSKPC
jgi:hypothetical protein